MSINFREKIGGIINDVKSKLRQKPKKLAFGIEKDDDPQSNAGAVESLGFEICEGWIDLENAVKGDKYIIAVDKEDFDIERLNHVKVDCFIYLISSRKLDFSKIGVVPCKYVCFESDVNGFVDMCLSGVLGKYTIDGDWSDYLEAINFTIHKVKWDAVVSIYKNIELTEHEFEL